MRRQCKMTVENAAKGRPFLPKSKTKTEQMNNRYLSRLLIAGTICLLAVCVQPAEAIVAGSATGSPPDSPANRVIDNNDLGSPFGGVGSVNAQSFGNGTGIPLSRWHVLTAGHILEINDGSQDGQPDVEAENITFNLNYGSNYSSAHTGLAVVIHPDFDGFNKPDSNPSVNDDLAIITLSTPIPEGVPIYGLYDDSPLSVGETLDFVGYGKSGYGDIGYSDSYPATYTVKRWGRNNIGSMEGGDDPGDSGDELWKADFDGPGGNGLGNDVETTFGIRDSGGPAFYEYEFNQYQLAGINSFVSGDFPRFGSGLGGILIHPYLTWIDNVLDEPILLPGDVNGNLFVCDEDLSIIINNWGLSGATREQGDLSGNYIVDGPDYAEVLSYWNTGIPPSEPSEPPEAIAAMPEPATVWLMILAGAILARRKRKQ